MITVAKVVAVQGELAVVEAARKSACEGCHKSSDENGCSVCSLLGGNSVIRANAKNTVGAHVGDTVEIGSSSTKMLTYAFLIFLLPIAVAVAAYFVAAEFELTESVRLACAAAGFVAVFFTDSLISGSIRKKGCDVEIVKIINSHIEI